MKTAIKVMSIMLGALLVVTMVGCPKQAVAPPPPPPPPEPAPEPPPPPPRIELNFNTIHFDFDKSDIRAGDATILQGNSGQLKKAADAGQKPAVTVEGYCDPIGTSEYNMALGMRRAESAKSYMVKLGADGVQLSTISYGEEKLVTQDEAQYEQNRRCEFKAAK